MTCQWNYTILQNSHRESGLFILKKVNHGVNGKTHNGHDLSVACFNDSKEGTNFNRGTVGNESLIRNHDHSSKLPFKVKEYLSTEKAF